MGRTPILWILVKNQQNKLERDQDKYTTLMADVLMCVV